MATYTRRAVRLIAAKRELRNAIDSMTDWSMTGDDEVMVTDPIRRIMDNVQYLLDVEMQAFYTVKGQS